MAQLIIWYGNLGFPRGETAALLAVALALGIAAIDDWRALLPLLLGEYFVSSMLMLDVADPRIALVTFIVGIFVSLILLLTALQMNWGRNAERPGSRFASMLPDSSRAGPLRLIRYGVLLLIVAITWFAGQSFPISGLPSYLNMPIYALVLLGIVTVVSTHDTFKAGAGIMLVLLGLGLFVTAFDQTFLVLLLFAALHLVVALMTSFMTLRQQSPELVAAQ